MRLELAEDLAHVLVQARRAPVMRDFRAPLNRKDIAGCAPAIHRMIHALRAPRPVSARGVALVSQLLSDGVGPLHNHRRAEDLASSLDVALAELLSSAAP
jgi:hypothetical protein